MSPPVPDNFDQAKRIIGELFHANQQLQSTHEQLSQTVTKLQSQVAWLTRQMFGRKSERYALASESSLFADFAESSDSDEPGISVEMPNYQAISYERQVSAEGQGRGKREAIADHLPRVERIHDLSEEEKAGPPALKRIGEEVSEQLAFEPGRVYVIRHVRYKYARVEQTLEEAPQVPNVILADKSAEGLPKCLAAPSLLAYIAVSKFADHRVQGEAVNEMREGLSWPGDRTRPQTSPNCDGQEPSWEASGAKGAARPRQVRFVKSNASEPLIKCRNRIQTMSKPGSGDCPGISMGGACNPAHVTSGTKAARARIRLIDGTLEPVVSMSREKPKRRPRKGESTDAGHRGGTTRSSVEGRVMRLERRGRVIESLLTGSTAPAGGTHE
jgi:transposase